MMKYKKYLAHVEFDPGADIFHGEVINIRDVITFQGKSTDALKQAFKDPVDDYLEFCTERGEKPDKPFSGRFTINLLPELHRRVLFAVDKSGKNMEN
jgi:predicted HicB family RNase H-like nuclease